MRKRGDSGSGGAGGEPAPRSNADAADAERRELVEPDREGRHRMSSRERDARTRIHTDRDPVDDIELAASDPRETDGNR